MTKDLIQKSIDINAPREKVWEVLLNDQYTRQWYAEFMPGSHALTDWKEGNKALFLDEKGSGIVGTVIANRKAELLTIEYNGVVHNHQEIYDTEEAKEFIGVRETYKLSGTGSTHLDIECDMAPQFISMMAPAWDRALEKIKNLSENLNSN